MGRLVPRYYQAECPGAVSDYLDKHPEGHPLIVMPTGAGKTLCIGLVLEMLLERGINKIVVITHVKEIIAQNSKLLKAMDIEHGVNSAGLGKREKKDITIAGIQSVYKDNWFEDTEVVIIDEAHLVPIDATTMYQRFFNMLGQHNRIGLTATPFRLGQGYIYKGRAENQFDDMCINYGTLEKFDNLVDEGFLSKITTKRTELEMDTSDISLQGGDFNEKELASKFNRAAITFAAIEEIVNAARKRKKWLIFAIDIDHAESIAEVLIRNGIPTAVVHSKMKDAGFDRDKVIAGFKEGKFRCVVNINILSTGFDEPGIDMIAMLRPTNSPTLHVQALGRGSRVMEGKADCLVLDFAGNTARLGPINNPLVKVKGRAGEGGEPITKTCPKCESILAPAVRTCPDCKHEFEFAHGLSDAPYEEISLEDGKHKWLEVHGVRYELAYRPAAPTMVKVIYNCSGNAISEFICIEHTGYAGHKARHWIKFRGGQRMHCAKDVIDNQDMLRVPSRIKVKKQSKYFSISESKFEEDNII